MKRINLFGINNIGEPVKLAKDVRSFTNDKAYFDVEILDEKEILITTPNGVYSIQKHAVSNTYQGICAGHKVHVSLKKVTGELRFW
jgi:hypothetical protein